MIYLGSDHGGFILKEKVKQWLTQWNYKFEDLGTHQLDPDDDYPTYAFAVAERVAGEESESGAWDKQPKGILLCRSAAGMVIAANKVPGIRAVAVFDETSAKHSREHNDANVLGISADWTTEDQAQKIIKTWLETNFPKEARHLRRINQIRDREANERCCRGSPCGCH